MRIGENTGESIAFGMEGLQERSLLRGLLESHVFYERLKDLRRVAIHVIAVMSAMLWVLAAWPQHFPSGFREFVLVAWCCFSFGALVVATLERQLYRRRQRFLSQTQRPTGLPGHSEVESR